MYIVLSRNYRKKMKKRLVTFSKLLYHIDVNEGGVISFPSSNISRITGTPVLF